MRSGLHRGRSLDFLMRYDVEYLSVFLFDTFIFSLAGYLFQSFLHFFFIELLVSLLLNFKISLCILGESPLSDIYSFKYFLPMWVCCFILGTRPFAEHTILTLMKSNLLSFSLTDHALGVLSGSSLPNTRSPRFLLYFILEIL